MAPDDVVKVGLDTDGDGEIDVDVSDDLESVTASNDGNTLELYFTGNNDINEGDRIVLDAGGLRNPTENGTYDVSVNSNGDVTKRGDVEIEP